MTKFDAIQLGMAGFGLTALWLAMVSRDPRAKKWAPVVGLVGQLFWGGFAWITGAWGLALLVAAYTFVYAMGARRQWGKSKPGRMITVVQVFRALNIDPIKDDTWGVGARASNMWLAEYGERPPTALRSKTNGGGSHQHREYPIEWFDRIADLIRRAELQESRQQELFD